MASPTLLDYEFESAGPNGLVKKVIQYRLEHANGTTFFHLGFGDWNEEEQGIDDRAVSNNGDAKKILATIAATIVEITDRYPDMMVFARGSTPARTRLYQMAIFSHRDLIDPLLMIYGYFNNKWERAKKNKNYDGFIAVRKKNSSLVKIKMIDHAITNENIAN